MESNLTLYIVFGLFLLLFFALVIETVILVRLKSHYDRFLTGHENEGLTKVLEGIQRTLGIHERHYEKLEADYKAFKSASVNYLQHLVVKRFNPFGNTGGDQSFILSLLDGGKNGIIITSLHSRENTRFYVKSVVAGEGTPHALSDEEKKTL